MPTYQYACTDPECGNRENRVAAMSELDALKPICGHCGSDLRREYTPPAVFLGGRDTSGA